MQDDEFFGGELRDEFRMILQSMLYNIFLLRDKNVSMIDCLLEIEFRQPFAKLFEGASKDDFIRFIYPKVEPGKFATPVAWFARVPRCLRDDFSSSTKMETLRLELSDNRMPKLTGIPNVPEELKEIIKNTVDKLKPFNKISEDLKKMGRAINQAGAQIGIKHSDLMPSGLDEEMLMSGFNYTCTRCVGNFIDEKAEFERLCYEAGVYDMESEFD